MPWNTVISPTCGGGLSWDNRTRVKFVLNGAGIVMLPSDTGYSVAMCPKVSGLSTTLHALSFGKDPISLSFFNLVQIERFANLSIIDRRIVAHHCPGPVTLVCRCHKIVSGELQRLLRIHNTVGCRLADSCIEREIASDMDFPITTMAVRDDRGTIVQSFDDAFEILNQKISLMENRPFFLAIRKWGFPYSDQSTVIATHTNPDKSTVIRDGAVDAKLVTAQVRDWSFDELVDYST